MTKDEMGGWNHRLNGHEFEQTPRDLKGREAWRAAVHGVSQARILGWVAISFSRGSS